MKVSDSDIVGRVEKLIAQLRESEKELDRMKHKLQSSQAGDVIADAKEIHGVKVLVKRVDGMDSKDLRDFGDKLRDKLSVRILWPSGRSRKTK